MKKGYLGDAVYIELNEHGDIILTTENGIDVTNRIVLEQWVYSNLLLTLNAWKMQQAREEEEE